MSRQKRICLRGESSNAFPGKCFDQYKLMLNLFYCMKHNELPGIHRPIVHVCAENQSVVKPRDAIGGQLKKYPSTTLKISIFSFFGLITVYFCLFHFSKFNFTYFRHNCHNHLVFRYFPECSGMFHVPCSMFHIPGFIDRPSRDHKLFKSQPVICTTLYLHILLSVSVDLQFALRALASN